MFGELSGRRRNRDFEKYEKVLISSLSFLTFVTLSLFLSYVPFGGLRQSLRYRERPQEDGRADRRSKRDSDLMGIFDIREKRFPPVLLGL